MVCVMCFRKSRNFDSFRIYTMQLINYIDSVSIEEFQNRKDISVNELQLIKELKFKFIIFIVIYFV